ncbi:MAG TPA: hypothetical protein VNR88_08965 [Hyphomicrobium sp.]|nr:hypothetical protein [Hyphomicrobium sp.]
MADGGEKSARAERLAAELRANLKKRKEQARVRARTVADAASHGEDGSDRVVDKKDE